MNSLPVPPSAAAMQKGPELRDIHLPPSPSWWPPAPGWWLLAALTLLLLLVGTWLWRRRRRAIEGRQRVLREVERLANQYQLAGDGAALAAGLHQLLRRVARQHDASAVRQTGSAWRHTLMRVPVDAAVLDRLLKLDELMYQDRPSFDHAAVISAVTAWLRVGLKPSAWKASTVEQADA